MKEIATPRTDSVYPPEIIDREFATHGNSWGWGTLIKMRDCSRLLERQLAVAAEALENRALAGCPFARRVIAQIKSMESTETVCTCKDRVTHEANPKCTVP